MPVEPLVANPNVLLLVGSDSGLLETLVLVRQVFDPRLEFRAEPRIGLESVPSQSQPLNLSELIGLNPLVAGEFLANGGLAKTEDIRHWILILAAFHQCTNLVPLFLDKVLLWLAGEKKGQDTIVAYLLSAKQSCT